MAAIKCQAGITIQNLLHHNWHRMLSVWLTFWIIFISGLNLVSPEVVYRVDPLALLAATLRTYQRAGCDSEQLSLSCPRGTSISIELAQYGRAGDLSDHSLCPPLTPEGVTTAGSSSGNSVVIASSNTDGISVGIIGEGSAATDVLHSGTQIEVKPPELCTVSGLQYTLLQTVVDACQKKRHCKFSANSKPFANGDPCAGIRKFVEIAYKCRPYEFRSKVACENDNMPLVCNPYSRIAIYSASFGYIERESVQCPHNNTLSAPDTNSKQTCLVSYATETVMQICHGRRRCSVTADAGTFGRPCKNDIPMHLKVVYTCIPRKVLKDRYETAAEQDEPQQTDMDLKQDELYDEDQFYKEGEAIPPAPKLQGAIPNAGFPYDFNKRSNEPTTTIIPFILSRNGNSLEENQEQFYLYLIISIAAGMLLCLTLVIGRLTLHRRRFCRKNSISSCSVNEKNSNDKMASAGVAVGGENNKFQRETTARETQLSGSFADDISDIDADIDLTNPVPVSSLSTSNETYMGYAPMPTCAYGSLGDHSSTNYGTATAMVMPSAAQQNTLIMPSGHKSINSSSKPLGCPTVIGSRQTTPPPPGSIYTSMGLCSPSVSGSMTMGPPVLPPSILSTAPNKNISGAPYLSGTIMVPGHHHSHTGTLRRQLVPTSMGIMSAPQASLVGGNGGPHSIIGVPTSSSIYYDSTIPRHLSRGLSADNTQYFYG